MKQNLFEKYIQFIFGRRWLIIAITLAIAGAAATGFSKIGFNGEYRVFFSEDNPRLQAFDEIQNTYSRDDNILFVVVPKNGNVITRENLTALYELTEESWLIPYSTRVDSITNFQWTRSHIEDGEEGILVTHLVEDPESLDEAAIASINKVVSNEPVLLNRLISPSAHVAAVNVTIELPGFGVGYQSTAVKRQFSKGKNTIEFRWNGLSLVPESISIKLPKSIKIIESKTDQDAKVTSWIIDSDSEFDGEYKVEFTGREENGDAANAAKKIARKFEEKYPDLEIKLTGMSMMNDAFNSTISGDLKSLNPLMYATILIVTFLLLRSVTATLITLLVIGLSTAIAMGTAFHTGFEMTGPSSSAPTMILTLAVADCIHILVLLVNFMRQGKSKEEAIKESLRINMSAVFLTSLTTAIGFLCMNFSDAPPYHDLGNITAAGVAAAFILSVTFLPAMVLVLPMKLKIEKVKEEKQMMNRLANFVITHRPIIFTGFTLFTITMGYTLTKNDLNDQFVNYFSKKVDFRNDTDFTMENLSGIYQIEFNLPAEGDQGVTSPDYLKTLDQFRDYMLEVKDVRHVSSVSDIFKKINRSMHNDDQEFYKIPDSKELAAQYLLLYELSLPRGFDLNNQINTARSATRFTVTFNNVQTSRIKEITATAENWLKKNAPAHMRVHAASAAIMFSYISENNINSMLFGTLWAMVMISVCLIFALKSLSFGLLSLIPNFMPAVMAFGVWGVINGQIGLGLSVVVCMTLGIVVDDTVHFLTKYMRARREQKLSAEEAVRATFKSVGNALVFTSVILTSGFFILTFSNISINSDMGKLTACTIILALVADLFFLPALLISFDKFLNRKEKYHVQ